MREPGLSETDAMELAALLRQRLAIIGDTALRDRDPGAHLEALKDASEAIFAKHVDLKPAVHPRLDHFLTNCSYEKALDYLEAQLNS